MKNHTNHLLTADMAASRVKAIMSAPTYPGVCLAKNFQSKSGSNFKLRHKTFMILSLAASSGMPIIISLSKRPARLNAVSKESGRFVAPITRTWALLSAWLKSTKAVHYCVKLRVTSLSEAITVHASQKLSDNSALHFPLCVLAFRGNGVDFVNEDYTRG